MLQPEMKENTLRTMNKSPLKSKKCFIELSRTITRSPSGYVLVYAPLITPQPPCAPDHLWISGECAHRLLASRMHIYNITNISSHSSDNGVH